MERVLCVDVFSRLSWWLPFFGFSAPFDRHRVGGVGLLDSFTCLALPPVFAPIDFPRPWRRLPHWWRLPFPHLSARAVLATFFPPSLNCRPGILFIVIFGPSYFTSPPLFLTAKAVVGGVFYFFAL